MEREKYKLRVYLPDFSKQTYCFIMLNSLGILFLDWLASDLSMWSESLSIVSEFFDPMDHTVHGILRPEYWSGQPFPSPGDLPNPGLEPRSPPLKTDSFPAEPQGSPRIREWVAYPFFSGSFWLRNWTRVFCIAGRFFTSWATREATLAWLYMFWG